MIFQDIHINDAETRLQFIRAVQANDMTTATKLLSDLSESVKALDARAINGLFQMIQLMEQVGDPNFKADKIQTATSAPSTLATGDIYFKEYA